LAECATLASIPQSPSKLNPRASEGNRKRLLERRDTALRYMCEQNLISETSLTLALAEPLPPRVLPSVAAAEQRVGSPYFVDYVRNRLDRDSDFKDDVLTKGGYRVVTTLNPQYQAILEEVVPKCLSAWVDKDPGNINVIEKGAEQKWQESKSARLAEEEKELMKSVGDTTPRKGQVRLMRIQEITSSGLTVKLDDYRGTVEFPREYMDDPAGGGRRVETGNYLRPYYNPDKILKKNGLIDVKIRDVDPKKRQLSLSWYDQRIQGAAVLLDAHTGQILALVGGANYFDNENPTKFKFNRATSAPRQPGSSFKPFLYAYALEHNYTPTTVIVDERIEYPAGAGNPPYIPRNFEKVYRGPTSLYWALAESNNAITVKLFSKLGSRKVTEFYRKFDIVEPEPTWDLKPYLPTCLGAVDITPLSIAAAYLPFTNRGVAVEPLCITRIEDLEGNPLKEIQARETRIMSAETAYIITAMLREAVRSGTAAATVGKFVEELGKLELTIPGFRVPQIAGKTGTTNASTNAWFVGYTPDLILTVWVGFDNVRSLGPRMTGSRAAAPLWIEIMRQILPTRQDWQPAFEPPSGIVYRDFPNGTFRQVPFNENVKAAVADEASLPGGGEGIRASESRDDDEAGDDSDDDRSDTRLAPPRPSSSDEAGLTSEPATAPVPEATPQSDPLLEPPRI
ncbi:MAG TPA: penicillin-binding transpeptidase domain-containing protein, partial [Candidatus Sumerlaeota bacterium]|nr:penicillin-binding transpeptidase domain-containing protein [Candidatus Sumerlaeota bacterium]